MSGTLRLGAKTAHALGRIAFDRLQEARGAALPRTREQLATPSTLNALLRSGGAADASALPRVRDVHLPGVDFESSNCTNFLIGLDHAGGDEDTAALPRTLYAKLPCDALVTRAFANAVGFWDVEVAFCQRLARAVPIRVPRVHAAVQRGSRFVLLLENLGEDPGVRLFLNRDMAQGTTPERARACLQTFAKLHAAFWGRSEAEREALLPTRLHPYLAPGGRALTRALNASAIAPAHRAAPDLFTARHADVCRLGIRKWDALVDAWYAEPLTLIHGDSHLANCFEYATPDGLQIGMLDFQGAQWCGGMRDVQYHLINSLEPDVLAAHEAELIADYLAALAGAGVALDPETATAQYRAYAFQTLMVAVVSIGLGSLTEREDTVRTILRRSVAAIDRLGFADWLSDL